MEPLMGVVPLTLMDCEHLFWLAAHAGVFFTPYNEETKGWDDYWRPVINVSDTFYYACADAEGMKVSDAAELQHIFEQYGWDGIVAWVAIKRDEQPLAQLQTLKYSEAYKHLKGNDHA